MRSSSFAKSQPEKPWHTVHALLLLIFRYPYRVGIALTCLIVAKLANVSVPLVLGTVVDDLGASLITVPIFLVVAYGLLRFSSILFTELRQLLFAAITQKTVKDISSDIFSHLLHLDLQFHLGRHTGELSRDLERGSRSIASLINLGLYLTIPILIEMFLVMSIMGIKYDWLFVFITIGSLLLYFSITIVITNWRVHLRRTANTMESLGNSQVVDALLNFETVKYFNNESYETTKYEATLDKWRDAATRNQKGLAYLNTSQSLITSTCAALVLWQAMLAVQDGSISVGGLVTLSTMLLQLFIPLNMLGTIYREVRHSIADVEKMFALRELKATVTDPKAPQVMPQKPLSDTQKAHTVKFKNISFAYHANRPILKDFSLTLEQGTTTAIVGVSGGGKSTLVRLIYRFYDVTKGAITIDGMDISSLTLNDLRSKIAIVPQDTVLFNTTIFQNIAYGKHGSTTKEVHEAARAAHLHEFIKTLPQGYDTAVGERGLKLSGGEKQRVAIARALLKNPAIMIFDEATSALDSHAEKAVQIEMAHAAIGRTTLIIAHRLSTVQHADNIAVIDNGQIAEEGKHETLLLRKGLYHNLWFAQLRENDNSK